MSDSDNQPSRKKQHQDQSEETDVEEMEVDRNHPDPQDNSAALVSYHRSRRSSPERFNDGDLSFPSEPFSDVADNMRHFELFLGNNSARQPDYDIHRREHHWQSPVSLDSFPLQHSGHPLMDPTGMAPLDPSLYDPSMYQGLDMSRDRSFDYLDDPSASHSYFCPPPYVPPRDPEDPNNEAESNEESMDDRKPAAMDTFRQRQYPQPEATHQMYPMQDRTSRRPQDSHPPLRPYASARTDNSSPDPSPPTSPTPLQKCVDVRSKRKLKPPPVGSIPSQRNSPPIVNPARNTSKKKATPKRGPGTHAKLPRRSARGNQSFSSIDSRVRKGLDLTPSFALLGLAKTPRKKQALYTWYRRLNELIDYKKRYGHTNVPQQYPPNHSLGIWVNKQRMEKKAMDAGEVSSMTQEKVILLEKAGFIWAKRKGQAAWEDKFRELQEYWQRHGHCNVPTKNQNNRALGRWVSTQRSNYKKFQRGRGGSLRPKTDDEEMKHRINRLEGIGFMWNLLPGNVSNEEQEEFDEEDKSNEEEEREILSPHDPLLPLAKKEAADGNDSITDQGNNDAENHDEES